MTGRHASTVRVSDSWLVDQWAAWARDVDAYFDQFAADQEERAGLTHEQVMNQFMDESARKSALLCTARLLAAEFLHAAEVGRDVLLAVEDDRVFDLGGDPPEYQPDEDGEQ